MTPFALQAAHMAARTMRDDPAFTGKFVGRPDESPIAGEEYAIPVFHPTGTVRLVTPLEDEALQQRFGHWAPTTFVASNARSAAPKPSLISLLLGVLVRIARFPIPGPEPRRTA